MRGKRQNMLVRRLSLVGAAICLIVVSGCLSSFHRVQFPPAECRAFCKQLPAECRNNVYVFLLNGVDPLDYGNLVGVRDYINGLGFGKTYYGQIYHRAWFADEIRRVHEERPDARFAIVGFDYGADAARLLAEDAASAGISIDLLCYLEPRGLGGLACCPNLPIRRVVNVCSPAGWVSGSKELTGSEHIEITEASRYAVPTHIAVIDLLTQELTSLAMGVPVYSASTEQLPPLVDPAPTPRPITTNRLPAVDEWDFLKPHNRQQVVETRGGDGNNFAGTTSGK